MKLLNHNQFDVANQIIDVFQASYRIEAALIGTDNFPPLNRTVNEILTSNSQFFGYCVDDELAGVIEITYIKDSLDICSLTVSPSFFRRGIAGQMILYVLDIFPFQHATVETATANLPAIALYKKHGFIEYKRWLPAHGIEKIAFYLEADKL